MSKGDKTDLQRQILLTWYENPNASNQQIADVCDCSGSYVSQIKNRFDGYDEMEYMFDSQDAEMERMFGGDIFSGQSQPVASSGIDMGQPSEGKGIGEMYEELPDNMAGNLMRAIILLILLYVSYEVATILIL